MHSLCRILFLCAILTSLLFIHVTKAGAILAALEHETVDKENCNPPGAVCSNDPPCCNPRCRNRVTKMRCKDKCYRFFLIHFNISINNRKLLYPYIKSIMIVPMRCWFVFLVATFVMKSHGFPALEPLTGYKCKEYLASNDIHKKFHGYFNCPRKFRGKNRKMKIF
ncbi:unnamed protein product [Rotaria socialis]